MYENDETIIEREVLYSYTDSRFGTDSSIELSVHVTTRDYKRFSKLKTSISVISSDTIRRKCSLCFPELYELTYSVNEATTNDKLVDAYERGKIFSIERLISDNILKFTFKPSSSGEWCVLSGILSSNTDYGLVILPIRMFLGLLDKLNYIKQNEFSIRDSLISRTMQSKQLEETTQMVHLIKSLPVHLSEQLETRGNRTPVDNNYYYNLEDNDDNESDQNQNGDLNSSLDNFMNDNLDQIELESLKNFDKEENSEQEKPAIQVDSKLFSNVLGNDILNLESLMNRILISESKIEAFSNTINDETGIDLLSKLDNNDVKHAGYISESFIQSENKQYLVNGNSYSDSCPMIKTKPLEIDQESTNIAFDLLICQAFIKTFRNRVESRTSDPEVCKSKLHVNFRYTADIFSFSFIDRNVSLKNLKNMIISRFRYFDQNGYFESMNEELEDLQFQRVKEEDISKYIEMPLSKIDTLMDVKNLHSQLFENGTLRIPPDNEFTKEQIIREAPKLEVIRMSGYDFNEESLKKFGIDLNEFSNDVQKIYIKTDRNPAGRKKSRTNIERFVSQFQDDLPENIKDNLLEYIKSLGKSDFDFENSGFLIEDLPENIVKALHVWNRSNKNEKYSEFHVRCEESVMSKEDIKNLVLSGNSNNEQNEEAIDWESIL